ncbi:MAG: PilZ domain-containing protein [Planctomycetes bacterium]|nr:PilZ domain-containing protein [Planctomycetota bacterium]
MLEAEYSPRPARVHTTQASARVAPAGESRRLRFGVTADKAGDELLDLSTKGLKIRTRAGAPALDEVLEIALRHPHLRGPIRVEGRVKWIQDEDDGAKTVGVEFEKLRDTTRVAIMQLVVLELGSTVYGEQGPLGYVAEVRLAEGEERRFVLYDRERKEIGQVAKRPTGFSVEGIEQDPRELVTLQEAVAAVFSERKVRLVPPVR